MSAELPKRYVWVDFMKAFLIMSIVVEHMGDFVFQGLMNPYTSTIRSFNLPAFFFLSGMFVSTKNNGAKILKSIAALLIPFLVFGGIWTYLNDKAPETLFTGQMHNGFWFLWTLLALRLIFCVRNLVADSLSHITLGSLAADFITIAAVLAISFTTGKMCSQETCSLFAIDTLRIYLLSYFMGHWYKVYALDRGYLSIPKVIIECFLILLIASFIAEKAFPCDAFCVVHKMIRAVCGTFVLVHFFRDLPEHFPGSSMVQCVGRRTLEIYVCHYFLIPYGLAGLFMPFAEAGSGCSLLLFCTIASIIVTSVCALVYFVEKHPLLNFILFGKIKS